MKCKAIANTTQGNHHFTSIYSLTTYSSRELLLSAPVASSTRILFLAYLQLFELLPPTTRFFLYTANKKYSAIQEG
jgi:hypothetical protein